LVSSRATAARREGRGSAPRGLEEDHGASLGGERLQGARPSAPAARREALEGEAVRGDPRGGEGREHGRRAGDDRDRQPLRGGGAHRLEAGIGDHWHPRIGHEQHPPTGADRLEQGLGALGLVVLVVREDPRARGDLEIAHQTVEAPRVLGGDELRAGEGPHQAHRGVQRIADRGGGEGEDSGLEHPAMLVPMT
jgi:hypothetical protein